MNDKMTPICEVIESVIKRGDYELCEMVHKIHVAYHDGDITEDDKERLDSMAHDYADPLAGLPDYETRLTALEHRVSALEGDKTPEGAIPEWEQKMNAQDAYKPGDKVTFKGKVYEAVMTTVYSPETYAAAWKLVE